MGYAHNGRPRMGKVFLLKHIEVPSNEAKELWRALVEQSPEILNVEMHGYEPNTQDSIVVWSKSDQIIRWESIISKYDIPQK